MREAFDIHCDIHSEDGINLDGVLKQVGPVGGEGGGSRKGSVREGWGAVWRAA
jgi:hypothetical protein